MSDFKLVPVEPTPEMLDAAIQDGVCVDGKPVWKRDVVFQAKWKYQQMLSAAPVVQLLTHPAITHCDNCGFDWLDNGLNPIGCPYCKQEEKE